MSTTQNMPEQMQKFDIVKMREQVVGNITKMLESKMLVAPSNYREEIFFTFQKLAELKNIDKCDVKNVCNEIAKIFRNDLAVTKNHCVLMVINSKNSQTGKALSMRWQYQGLLHVAKSKCGIKRVSPVLVWSEDTISFRYDNGNLKVEHNPSFEGDLKGGYCTVEYNDGNIETKYYTRSELDKRRERSQKQTVWENRKPSGQNESNFWRDWEREMYEKTLINATLKRIIETSGESSTENMHDVEYDAIKDISFEEITDNKAVEIIEQAFGEVADDSEKSESNAEPKYDIFSEK